MSELQTLPTLTLSELARNGHALPYLGVTVTWSPRGWRASDAQLAGEMPALGLGEFLPKPISPRVALRRALTALGKHGPAAGQDVLDLALTDDEEGESEARPLIRTVNEPGSEWMVYALIAERVNRTRLTLRYTTALRVKLHKQTGALVVTTTSEGDIDAASESQKVAGWLAPYYALARQTYLSTDISEIIKSIVGWGHGIGLRYEGGVYFVPRDRESLILAAQALIARLVELNGGDGMLLAMPVPDVDATKRQVGRAAHADLRGRAERLAADLDKLLADPADPPGERKLASLRAEYNDLLSEVDQYADLLSLRVDDITGRVKGLRKRVVRLILGED